MKIRIVIILLPAVLTLALTACGSERETDQIQLDGTSWVLVAYDKTKPIEGTAPRLLFHTGQIYSSADCNTIGGGYSIEGDRKRQKATEFISVRST